MSGPSTASAPAFDYVVIGGGSAGCVIASRLSEDQRVSVLVLEAGSDSKHPLLDMPIAWPIISGDPRFDWGYWSEPDPKLNNRRVQLRRGRVLGGSSKTNAMRYSRGQPADYDRWRQFGLRDWGYSDVLPYFRRSEDHWNGANAYHGAGGGLTVRKGAHYEPVYDPIRKAVAEAGYPEVDDIHGERSEGLARVELTVDSRGRRRSAAAAFLGAARSRPNLKVWPDTLVSRIRIENGRATGVEYLVGNETRFVAANREVILSAGAFNSPQILMLSGIGDAAHLKEHGIAPVLHRPAVGGNLMDHPALPVVRMVAPGRSYVPMLRRDRAALAMLQWALFGRGPYVVNGSLGGLFVRTTPDVDQPDVQIIFGVLTIMAQPYWPWEAKSQRNAVQWSVSIQNPSARGRVGLHSADPRQIAAIHLNLFGEQHDIDTGIRGVKLARRIWEQPSLRSIAGAEILPGEAAQSDDALTAYIRDNAATTSHASGTCRMGVDDEAVVDERLNLRGIAGLRVADASVMPGLPGGHINAGVIMIGERAADFIRGRSLPRAEVG